MQACSCNMRNTRIQEHKSKLKMIQGLKLGQGDSKISKYLDPLLRHPYSFEELFPVVAFGHKITHKKNRVCAYFVWSIWEHVDQFGGFWCIGSYCVWSNLDV